MASAPLPLTASPIRFGTDGWRGILGVDITVERLLAVATASAQELAFRAPKDNTSSTIVIGYDRRFLAPELAEAIGAAVRGCGLEPLLASTPVPTPACSWAVVQRQALGALVITASHNPPEWLGLKIKGPFGGSVEGDFTAAVERRLKTGANVQPMIEEIERIDIRAIHLQGIRRIFDIKRLRENIEAMGLQVIVDPMHGSAAGCIAELLGGSEGPVREIRSHRDPLFGGNSPEPLADNLTELMKIIRDSNSEQRPCLGLVFDGDGDRIAAVDETGNFCSTQKLIPVYIDHLARSKQLPGKIVKTVSGSDLMQLVAEGLGRDVVEVPVGFKHIALKMMTSEVLIGGEESGGVGFGMHIPERDAIFAAMLLLEAVVEGKLGLGKRIKALESRFDGKSHYERRDLRLPDMQTRKRLETMLDQDPPRKVSDVAVKTVTRTDGVKLRLGPKHWLMMRFSGTEPLLRLYCEAPTAEDVRNALDWAEEVANSF